MKSKRIAILTRRFWPLSGVTEQFIADLADSFSRKGNEVTVVTAAWQKEWPLQCSFREFQMRRVNRPASGPWGTFRYQRPLLQMLNKLELDGVLMFGMGRDVPVVKKMLGDSIPLVLRIDHRHLYQRGRNARKPYNIESVDALICDSRNTFRELNLRKFILPKKVDTIVDGVVWPNDQDRSLFRQANARTALGDAHPVFRIEPAQPLVVTSAPFDSDGGMIDLIDAWKVVLEGFPKAKLWLLGDGPRGRKIWERISSLNMVYSAIMPGYFDDHAEIFHAADLYVHPLRRPVNCRGLFEAISWQLCPVVTQDSVEPLEMLDGVVSKEAQHAKIEKDVSGIIAPSNNPTALGEAITMALRNSELRAELGRNAAQKFKNAVHIDRVADRFLKCLFPADSNINARKEKAGI